MGVNIKKASEGIFKMRIDISRHFDDFEDGDVWIELREPTQTQANSFLGKSDPAELAGAIMKVIPQCLTDHSFINEDNTKAKDEDVIKLLEDRAAVYLDVAEQWQKTLPLAKRSSGKSGNSQA